MIRSFIYGKGPAAIVDEVMSGFNYERLAAALVVFIFATRELGLLEF